MRKFRTPGTLGLKMTKRIAEKNCRLLQQQISPPKCRSTWVLNQSTGPKWVGEFALRFDHLQTKNSLSEFQKRGRSAHQMT